MTTEADWVARIDAQVEGGDLDAARRSCEDALRAWPIDLSLIERAVRLAVVAGGPGAGLELLSRLRATPGIPADAARLDELDIELVVAAGDDPSGVARAAVLLRTHPDSVRIATCLLDALELAGRFDEALALARKLAGRPATHDLGEQRAIELEATARDYPAWLERHATRSALGERTAGGPARAGLGSVFAIFGGNTAMHARQVRFRDGSWGYIPAVGTLAEPALRSHVRGQATLGFYLLDAQSRVRCLVLDLDVVKDRLESYRSSSRARTELEAAMHDQLRAILARAHQVGLRVLLERSGFKGYHVWAFLEPVAAASARTIAQALVSRLEIPSELAWEVFPKQDRLSGKGLGNLVKLPLGLHQRSREWSQILDPRSLEPLSPREALETLARWIPHTVEEIGKVARALGIREKRPEAQAPEAGDAAASVSAAGSVRNETAPEDGVSGPSAATVIIPLPAILPAGVGAVVDGCGVMRELMAKARKGARLDRIERHVLAHVFAHLESDGRLFVHQVLAHGPAVRSKGDQTASRDRTLRLVPPPNDRR